MVKQKTMTTVFVVAILAIVGIAALAILGGQQSATTVGGDLLVDEDGQAIGKWAEANVPIEVTVKNAYNSTTPPAPTLKFYKSLASAGTKWENPRATFDDADSTYSFTAGTATISDQKPGTYYLVIEQSGFNTEFVVVEIPDGSEDIYRTTDYTEYQNSPRSKIVEMSAVGSLTDANFTVTLSNETNYDNEDQELFKVAKYTELRLWKAVVSDVEGFATDTNGDGTYDEGVRKLTITIDGNEFVVFDKNTQASSGEERLDNVDTSIDLFIDGVIESKENLIVEYAIEADETSDSVSANDEKWGEGEGILSTIKVFDVESNLALTSSIVA